MKKVLIICILLINNIYSQNEDLELDPTFANNGTLVLTDIKQADHITTDSFNNIIFIGKTHSNQSLAVKLLPDGDIDNSFGANGKVFFDYTIYKAFVLNNDKIILIGRQNTPSGIKIFLLNTDGSFDDDFGEGGVFSHQTTEYVLPVSVFEQDNRYLITGSHGAHNIFLLKIFADGTPDTSFGDNGLLLAPFPVDMGGESKDFKIEESAIYTFGHGYLSKFVINKYTDDGQLDISFAGDGNIIIDEYPNVNVRASSLYIHNDYIFVVGRQHFPGPPMSHSYAKIFKINKNTGVFDTSFGNNGALGIGLTGGDGGSTSYSAGYSSVMQENGNIIIGGHASAYEVNNTQMHNISPNGSFVSYKEFDFYATYNSFCFQYEDTFLAAGLNSDNFLFISRHKLSNLSVPNHINTDFSLEIYPNPATVNFKIETNQIIKSVKIYNTLGKLERTFLPSESYNISDLNSGIYFIQVEGMERNSTKKLLKH